jgi:hypothetical protein
VCGCRQPFGEERVGGNRVSIRPFKMPFHLLISRKDVRSIFAEPVDPKLVPDYYNVIRHPMSFKAIESKIFHHDYAGLKDFKVGDDMSRL